MPGTMEARPQGGANPQKRAQFEFRLQLDGMKLESLVMAHQHGAVNTFPGLAVRPY